MTDITSAAFGVTRDGRAVTCYIMKNDAGMTVSALDYGCTLQSIVVPDRDGNPADIVLGYDDLAGYEAGTCWFGAFVGRYANRIKNAAFSLNGRTYTLPANDGQNHLHGTFDHRVFSAAAENGTLVLRYTSPDGEEGFPGRLEVTVTYMLTENSTLVVDYRAVTDADTVVNLTNHSYFNLDGQTGGDVLGQTLQLAASRFTEGNEETIPTGRILPVEGTALDFRTEKTIGRDIDSGDEQLVMCSGYDQNFILDREGPGLAYGGTAFSAKTGIGMSFYTTQPAVQLYSGNFVAGDGAACGKCGLRYPKRGGFCLETQHYPCSPNFPDFPSTVLRPGETYHETTKYRFFVR